MKRERDSPVTESSDGGEVVTRRKAFLVGVISVILLAGAGILVGIAVTSTGNSANPAHSTSGRPVPGESYQICAEPRYLTSPWTYHALAAGSRSYTVAQYESLAGYGTTLPPLPAYIAREMPDTEAAVIYAPGSDRPPVSDWR
jgi:hypothetical protein